MENGGNGLAPYSDGRMMTQATRDELEAFFRLHGISDVECLFPDVSGYPRGKLMPAHSFAAGAELRIAQAIPMQCVTGEYSDHPIFPDADPDLRLVPDYRTLRRTPWSSVPRAFAIHDCLEFDGSHCAFAPRSLLQAVVARYIAQGLRPVVAPEARPLIQAVARPARFRRTRPRPSRMEKDFVSVPSDEIWTVPSVRMPSTAVANRRMRAHEGAEIFDFRFLIFDFLGGIRIEGWRTRRVQ